MEDGNIIPSILWEGNDQKHHSFVAINAKLCFDGVLGTLGSQAKASFREIQKVAIHLLSFQSHSLSHKLFWTNQSHHQHHAGNAHLPSHPNRVATANITGPSHLILINRGLEENIDRALSSTPSGGRPWLFARSPPRRRRMCPRSFASNLDS